MRAGRPQRSPRRAVLLGLLLLVLAAAATVLLQRDGAPRRPVVARPSVAVLGLQNTSGKAADAWLATALAEMIGTELARGETLRTVPGETVARVSRELELAAGDGTSPETLRRLRALLGCDYVVAGSYLAVGDGDDAPLRLDLRLADAALGTTVSTFAESAPRRELFTLVGRVGQALRQRLGSDVAPADGDAGLPRDSQAARYYAEGLEKLRNSVPQEARQLLEQAQRREPDNPLIHAALSEAWEALGHPGEARDAARRAFELAAGLPREERLLIEGRYRETLGEWPAAAQAYATLWELYPDNLEYGLRLAAAQIAARQIEASLRTVEDMRFLPPPSNEDPRIDLWEAAAHGLAGDLEAQLAAASRAAERAGALGAGLLVAQAYVQQAQTYRLLGRLEEAERAARAALDIYAGLDDDAGAAAALTNWANVLFARGEIDAAADFYDQAYQRYRELEDSAGMAFSLNAKAILLRRQGALDDALELYRQAETLFRESGNLPGQANVENSIAAVLFERDALAAARQGFEQARATWDDLGDRLGSAASQHNVAVTLRLAGELEDSRKRFEEALETRRALGHKAGEARSLTGLASVLIDLGELAQADEHLSTARQLAEDVGDRAALADVLFWSGELRLHQGALTEAQTLHEQALELHRALAEARGTTDSRIALARVTLEQGRDDEAARLARLAVDDCRRFGRRADEARALALLARIEARADRPQEAGRLLEQAGRLVADSERRDARLFVALETLRVTPAAAALERLERTASDAGYLPIAVEARLLRAAALLRAGDRGARELLIQIQDRAASRGLGRIGGLADRALGSQP